jgi:hypothetical protein
MKAILKGMWCETIDVPIDQYRPENPDCFSLRLTLRIGADGVEGTNDFDLYVCTPSWLDRMLKYEWEHACWGQHMLIVSSYDLDLVTRRILAHLDDCTGTDFQQVIDKMREVAAWEFDNRN